MDRLVADWIENHSAVDCRRGLRSAGHTEWVDNGQRHRVHTGGCVCMRWMSASCGPAVSEVPGKSQRVTVWISTGTGKLNRYSNVARVRTAGVNGGGAVDVNHGDGNGRGVAGGDSVAYAPGKT